MSPVDWNVLSGVGVIGWLTFALWALSRKWWIPYWVHEQRCGDLQKVADDRNTRITQLDRENAELRRLIYQHAGLIERTVDVVVERRPTGTAPS